jgi:glycerol-3-phosphate dehydrogenase (NAD(P)+)
VAEGVSTAREIYLKAQALGIDMPIVECVYRIIYQQANIQQEVSQLLTRQPKSEFISDKK